MDDPYSILGVTNNATADQIRAAYRRLARLHHPDRFAAAPPGIQRLAQRKMSDLNLAYGQIGPRSMQPKPDPVASAYSIKRQREDMIREERFRRWQNAEHDAKERFERQSKAAAQAAGSAASAPPPSPAPRPDPRKVFGGDGEQLDGPTMFLRRIERLRAKAAQTSDSSI
ncbi:MAG TPA: J domain-containing protein [Actinomycetota bacterium]|jgi:hypothetical protein